MSTLDYEKWRQRQFQLDAKDRLDAWDELHFDVLKPTFVPAPVHEQLFVSEGEYRRDAYVNRGK